MSLNTELDSTKAIDLVKGIIPVLRDGGRTEDASRPGKADRNDKPQGVHFVCNDDGTIGMKWL